jgi:hypothetical protein
MILDTVEPIELTDAEEHFDARMALARLSEGLFWVYRTVSEVERQTRLQASKDNTEVDVVGGVLENKPLGLLSCAFQWYAVSACNYAQLVGFLATGKPDDAKAYMRRVLPRISLYRNKVAAHFAMADPRRDNEADLAASVMTHIVYARGRLCAAALTPVVKGATTEVVVSRDYSWSLTLAHERLTPRYWPNGPTKSFQSLRIPPGKVEFNLSWSDLMGDGV